MDFWTAVQTCFSKYATFQGRARRSEFWYFWFFVILGGMACYVFDSALGTTSEYGGILGSLFSMATLLPAVAAGARRLHDTDRSGWWQLAASIPLFILAGLLGILGAVGRTPEGVMAVVVLVYGVVCVVAALVLTILVWVWYVSAGDYGANRFGPDPIGRSARGYPYAGLGGGAWR